MTPEQPTPRKRGRPKVDDSARLSHVLQLRLNEVQRGYLMLLADDWGCAMGEAVRRLIDEHLDGQPVVDGLEIGGQPATLRQALSRLKPAPDWVAEKFPTKDGG